MAGGRPTDYDPAQLPKLKELAEAGATVLEMSDYMKVSESTFYRWLHVHPEFRKTVKTGKDLADERVIQSLYRRALGYSHDSVKIFCNKDGEVTQVPYREHFPPDPTSAIFWLKNRKSQDWRDKSEVEIPGLAGLADSIAKARQRVK